VAVENRYDLKVNIKGKKLGSVPMVTANDSVVFDLTVYDDASPFILDPTYIYLLVSKRAKEDSVIREGELVGNKVRVKLGASEIGKAGMVDATLQILDSENQRVSSASFKYSVESDPSTSGSLPADDKTLVLANESLLTESIEKSNQAIETASTADVTATEAKNTAESVQEQFNQVVIEGDSSPQVSQALAGTPYSTLKEKHEADAALLAQNTQKIPNVANGEFVLNLLNPYGDFQNIHPKVLYFENGWNGYKYWMAYTPYPNGNWRYENPCIAVSNDKVNWGLPTGLESGLLESWNQIEYTYNNDTHLVYRSDLNRLEVWWRFVDENTDIVHLHRKTSVNGTTWSEKEIMFTGNRKGNDHLSPAIVYEGNKYKMLSVNTVGTKRILNYTESSSGNDWSTRTEANCEWDGLTPWHVDFINEGDKYSVVLQAWEDGKDNNTSNLYYLSSNNLIDFTKPNLIISPSISPGAFDNSGIYRSSIIKVGSEYTLFYSAVSKDNKRAMSISEGKEILSLKGIKRNLGNFGISQTVNNLFEVRQSTSPTKYGGLKVGNILFADGATDGVTPEEGAIRFRKSLKTYEKYNGNSWVPLIPDVPIRQVFAENNAEQNLKTANEYVDISFNTVRYSNNTFNGTAFTAPESGFYRFNVALQLLSLNPDEEIEVYLRRDGTTNIRTLTREMMKPVADKIYLIQGTGVVLLNAGNSVTVSVKYKGSALSAKVSSYTNQSYLYIEKT
jgi:hypothetical protein